MSTNINDIYSANGNFLNHADLKGKKVNVTIASAEVGEVGSGADKKKQIILGFKEGSGKKLGLNKTNANMIAFLTGTEDYTNWIGIRITIKPSMTEYQGRPTPCIRVADELPPHTGQAVAPPPPPPPVQAQAQVDDDCPF
jgi:hypothetical protein